MSCACPAGSGCCLPMCLPGGSLCMCLTVCLSDSERPPPPPFPPFCVSLYPRFLFLSISVSVSLHLSLSLSESGPLGPALNRRAAPPPPAPTVIRVPLPQLRALPRASKGTLITLMRSGESPRSAIRFREHTARPAPGPCPTRHGGRAGVPGTFSPCACQCPVSGGLGAGTGGPAKVNVLVAARSHS